MTRCAILRCRFIFAACFALLLAARPAAATIEYKISLAHPEKHAFQVVMRVPVDADQRADQRDLIVALPAWNALYQVRDFAYRVRDVRIGNAAAGAAPVVPYKLDKQTWRIPASAAVDGSIDIEYSISWDEAGPFNSQLSAHHAFVNFAEVLMYVPDRRAENVEVKFTDVPSDWKSIAELPSGSAPNSFTAESYDKLVDAPVEIGKFEEFEFDNARRAFPGGSRFQGMEPRHARGFAEADHRLRSEADGRSAVQGIHILLPHRRVPGCGRRRNGACQRHCDWRQFG